MKERLLADVNQNEGNISEVVNADSGVVDGLRGRFRHGFRRIIGLSVFLSCFGSLSEIKGCSFNDGMFWISGDDYVAGGWQCGKVVYDTYPFSSYHSLDDVCFQGERVVAGRYVGFDPAVAVLK